MRGLRSNFRLGLTLAPSSRVGPLLCASNETDADATGCPPRHTPSCGARPPRLACNAPFAPHELRHAHSVEMAREGVPLIVIQRQLGHSTLGITSVYLRDIDSGENPRARAGRPSPMIPASASLRR